VHTSTKSAAYFEEKQANVAAADAKKIHFNTGAWRKAEVRVRSCQGRGLRHRSKACRGTYDRSERTCHDQQGRQWMRSFHHYKTLHRCSPGAALSGCRWWWQCSNNFPVRVSAAERRHLSVSRYCGLTIFPAFSGTLGPSSTDDSTIFQFFITVTILVFPLQPGPLGT
jgi:hypothetical protein